MAPRVDGFEPILEALSTGAERYFGDSRATLLPVSRLGRLFSDLLRVRITAGDREYHAYVKVYKPREPRSYGERVEPEDAVLAEYDATAQLHSRMGGGAGLMAPRPIAVFPDRLAIVTEEVSGVPFDRLLRRAAHADAANFPAIATRIGTWVRTYQRVTGARGALSLAEQRSYVDERLRYLAPRVISHDERAATLGLFDDLAGQVTPAVQPLVAIHADLCPANILITPDGDVTVLDFAMANSGTRFHDISHLFMHLAFLDWRPRLRGAGVDGMQQALLRGYDESVSTADPLFRLMLLQHVVCHVTFVADRDSRLLAPALRWFARSRWRRCFALPALQQGPRPDRRRTAAPVHPQNLPLH